MVIFYFARPFRIALDVSLGLSHARPTSSERRRATVSQPTAVIRFLAERRPTFPPSPRRFFSGLNVRPPRRRRERGQRSRRADTRPRPHPGAADGAARSALRDRRGRDGRLVRSLGPARSSPGTARPSARWRRSILSPPENDRDPLDRRSRAVFTLRRRRRRRRLPRSGAYTAETLLYLATPGKPSPPVVTRNYFVTRTTCL